MRLCIPIACLVGLSCLAWAEDEPKPKPKPKVPSHHFNQLAIALINYYDFHGLPPTADWLHVVESEDPRVDGVIHFADGSTEHVQVWWLRDERGPDVLVIGEDGRPVEANVVRVDERAVYLQDARGNVCGFMAL